MSFGRWPRGERDAKSSAAAAKRGEALRPLLLGPILALAKILQRRPGDAGMLVDPRWDALKMGVFALFLLASGVGFGALIVEEILWRTAISKDFLIENHAWRALYEHDPVDRACGDDARDVASCPANVRNPALWSSLFHRGSDHETWVRTLRGKRYWIGTVVEASMLRRAGSKRANHLLLGLISGSFRVYLDGMLIEEAWNRQSRVPAVIALPFERLMAPEPLHIAIEIQHDTGALFPDRLDPDGARLVTSAEADAYKVLCAFHEETRPAMVLITNLLVALAFLGFWLSARGKQEYFYLSIFCLIQSMIQGTQLGFVYREMGQEWMYRAQAVARLHEAFFGLLLGLSYARTRLDWFRVGVVGAVTIPLAVGLLPLATADFQGINGFTAKKLVPIAYGLGALAAIAQGLAVRARFPVRWQRLAGFAICLVSMGVLYWFQAQRWGQLGLIVVYRIGHTVLVVFVAAILLLDFRELERLLRTPSRPKWFQRETLPAYVEGILVKLDLKQSRQLALSTGRSGMYSLLSNGWRQLMLHVAYSYGGEFVGDGGDDVVFFFDGESRVRTLEDSLEVTRAMEAVQRTLERGLDLPRRLGFRAALLAGRIEPRWADPMTRRNHIFSGDDLVLIARIQELERRFPSGPSTTQVVAGYLASTSQPPSIRWDGARGPFELADKEDQVYVVSVTTVGEANETEPSENAA